MSASDTVSKYIPTRAIVLGFACWSTWKVTEWGMWFAVDNARNGVEIAAIVAAVTAPVAALGGYVFRTYVESK